MSLTFKNADVRQSTEQRRCSLPVTLAQFKKQKVVMLLKHCYSPWLIIAASGTTRTGRLGFIIVHQLPLLFLVLPG